MLFDDREGGDPSLQALAKAIAETSGPARLQVCSGTQWFPWAILYDGDYRQRPLSNGESVDPASFWGGRFQIDRMIYSTPSAGRAPTLPARVRVQPCLNATIDARQQVAVLAGQRALFEFPSIATAAWIESRAAFEQYLRTAPPCERI